ncbi:hypothetical protein SynRS9902_01373 [Synechococcus sp. RS9902]|nr:hypothetical protein SynRS9902_01373 [Synechococcus sp. RS9902]
MIPSCASNVCTQLVHSNLIDVQGERTTFGSVGARLRVIN